MLSPEQLDQYAATRRGAALIDRHTRGRIVIRGRDRTTFLQALLTNDVAVLTSGTGCYAGLLTPQGRFVSDMRVFELGDAILLDVPGAKTQALLAKFDQLIFTEDVQVGDLSEGLGCASVQGPKAAEMIGRAFGADDDAAASLAAVLESWMPYRNQTIDVGGDLGILARVDEIGLPGYFVFAPPTRLPSIAAAIAAAGAAVIDEVVAETIRIESGVPLFGADLTDDIIPLEAGLETSMISHIKGCYPGQEVIVRIRDRGQGRVVRRLVGLVIDGDVEASVGDVLMAGGKDVGRVTSAACSPALGKPVALGYVHRDFVAPGSAITVVHGDTQHVAVVAALPLAVNTDID
jgi:folate-binding protein YgfZ